MVAKSKHGALSTQEKQIVKALLNDGWRNQDIQALVNIGRRATINSARITEVKKNTKQKAATTAETEYFQIKKHAYDPVTGLNFIDDERLVRSREAMILAVQIFNSTALNFKTEIFSVLANIAWTYLLHEYFERQGKNITNTNGETVPLSLMLNWPECPLTEGMKNNLDALKKIRDEVEHKLLGSADKKWFALYQACCLNFDRMLCELFGKRLTLAHNLSFALQFTKMDIEQLGGLNEFEIPPHIQALDARLEKDLTDDQLRDLEYQFRVIYTLDASSKGKSHLQFVKPDSAEGKEIQNILVNYKAADDLYPHKPSTVWQLVTTLTGKNFNSRHHTQAWRHYKVRPKSRASHPEQTNKEFCIYHPAHKDYTYSQNWVDYLVSELSDESKFDAIRTVRL